MKNLEAIVLAGLFVLFFGGMILMRIMIERAEKRQKEQRKD
jgi:hypothetical protein